MIFQLIMKLSTHLILRIWLLIKVQQVPPYETFQWTHFPIDYASLDEQIVSTKVGGVQHYQICWKGWPESDYTWTTIQEL